MYYTFLLSTDQNCWEKYCDFAKIVNCHFRHSILYQSINLLSKNPKNKIARKFTKNLKIRKEQKYPQRGSG